MTSLKEHAASVQKHLHKFIMFLAKNKDMPFKVKLKVFEAAFNSAVLYGCESWLDVNCRVMDSIYMSAIKALLCVKVSTPNICCLAELGLPPLHIVVKQKQSNFLRKIMSERSDLSDDPLMFCIELTRSGNPRMSRYIESVICQEDFVLAATQSINNDICASQKTKCLSYHTVNPHITVHDVYKGELLIPERFRIAFTRLRLSSHRLRIETGRWSRLARDRRLCVCGHVQDEKHVVEQCPLTQQLRVEYGRPVNFPDFFMYAKNVEDFKYLHDVLKVYEN
jgi:hypothetical protein